MEAQLRQINLHVGSIALNLDRLTTFVFDQVERERKQAIASDGSSGQPVAAGADDAPPPVELKADKLPDPRIDPSMGKYSDRLKATRTHGSSQYYSEG